MHANFLELESPGCIFVQGPLGIAEVSIFLQATLLVLFNTNTLRFRV